MNTKERPIWNQKKVDWFLNSVSGGIKPANPYEVALLASSILTLLLLALIIERRVRKKRRSEQLQKARQNFEQLIVEKKLSPGERDLVLQLAAGDNDPEILAPALLQDSSKFQMALKSYLKEQQLPATTISRLRWKLNFEPRRNGHAIFSTADLPPETLIYNESGEACLSIQSQAEDFFQVSVIEGASLKGKGFLHRHDGRYALELFSLGEGRYRHCLLHKEKQKRNYYRQPVQIIGRYDRHPVTIVDLGGGGARLQHRSSASFAERAILSFQLGERSFQIPARIVLRRNNFLHLAFESLQEGERDVIYKHLFELSRKLP